jgi:hypothetical protein
MRRFVLAAFALTLMAACGRATERGSEVRPTAPVYSLAEVDTRPVFKSCAEPNLAGGLTIGVLMHSVLGFDGIPEPVTIKASVYRRPYDQSTIYAARHKLKRCQWTPALIDGEPVRVQMTYLIYVNR